MSGHEHEVFFRCEVCGLHFEAPDVLAHMETHIGKEVAIPDVAGEIIGGRAWKVEFDVGSQSYQLKSATRTFVWPKKTWAVATCSVKGHAPPHEKCSCGLYAAKTRAQLLDMHYHVYDQEDVVVGEVAMAGKVIPGTQGWRAEKARVAKVYVPFTRWRLAELIRDEYGVPVELDNTLRYDDDEEDED
jgi:hypothetical protein